MQMEYGFTHLMEINEMIKETSKIFNIGDVIKITDGSNNIDKNTLEKRYGIDELFKTKTAEIIKKDLFIIQSDRAVSETEISQYQVCDILVRFESGEEVYTSSLLIRLSPSI